MPEYPEIFILRHGQTEWNAARRHQGRLDSPLTALGQKQATAMGRILQRTVRHPEAFTCHSSPQGRAWATAGIALAALGRQAQRDDRLQEVGFGVWEGLTEDEIDARWPGSRADTDMFQWHFTAPGGERFDALQARTQSFLDDLAGPAIIVTHGIASRVLRGTWLGLEFSQMSGIGGGQGVVYHLRDGAQMLLQDGPRIP